MNKPRGRSRPGKRLAGARPLALSPRRSCGRLSGTVGCLLFLLGGCAEQNGILEIDSGPPISRSSDLRNATPTYAVHGGETITMRFRAKIGICDYAVMQDESNGQCVDCGPPLDGRFEWKYAVGGLRKPDQPIRLTVSGYGQKGSRDRMPMGGRLVEAERANDEPDDKVAQVSVLLQVYQSTVEIQVSLPNGRPDWSLTKLAIARADGRQTKVGRSTATQRGFDVAGPDEAGVWRVRFEPVASEVNSSGETTALLQVADETGQITVFRQSFATP